MDRDKAIKAANEELNTLLVYIANSQLIITETMYESWDAEEIMRCKEALEYTSQAREKAIAGTELYIDKLNKENNRV